LPPDLVTAFRATLEELREADLFLHVVDASSDDYERRIEAVRSVLREIGLGEVPELLVFNKIDLLPPGEGAARAAHHQAVPVSALERTGLADLLERAEKVLWHEEFAGEPLRLVRPEAQIAQGRGGQ
ncbi:MAG: hypothetical protein R3263_05270, partial [Myxococcota bacterium]|nr:hypothetical protein [Myxococcota bacterium]